VFERFTDRARQVVVGAQAEALALNHTYIGTEHILLGLLSADRGTAFELLSLFGVSIEEARQRVEEIIGRGRGVTPASQLPFTPRAKKVLEMSLREALQLGDNYIGTQHILLGLLREGEGIGAQVLFERGLTLAAVRERIGDVATPRQPPPSESEEPRRLREDEVTVEVPAGQFSRLLAEIPRLRDLLRRHGIDPGAELPDFGQE
jgi:ATP-dependent Clp protease ATP-binding subunit ClpC